MQTSKSVSETYKIAENLLKNLANINLICLYGELGAGKTTFVQGLAKGLGIKKRVISPTFVMMREYKISRYQISDTRYQTEKAGGQKKNTGNWQLATGCLILYHIDLYRIESESDLKSIDLEELWSDPKNLVIIEWAEKIKPILPKKRIDVKFEYVGEKKRRIFKEWVNG